MCLWDGADNVSISKQESGEMPIVRDEGGEPTVRDELMAALCLQRYCDCRQVKASVPGSVFYCGW